MAIASRSSTIRRSPAPRRAISYAELLERVARLAGALAARGVGKGDRVIIYMPMIPEALVAMLACARLGAIHSVVFGGFAAPELAVRIDDARPKAIIAASCGIEPGRVVAYKPLVDAAIGLAAAQAGRSAWCSSAPQARGRDGRRARPRLARGRRQGAEPAACAPVGGMDPLYILYTSGTTGQPKGVVRPNAGHMVALAWTMRNIYAIAPGEVFWTASDVGWVVGHSYICYGPLLVGATTVVFEGKPVGTPGRRDLLAGDRRAPGAELLHRADRVPRDQARGSGRARSSATTTSAALTLPVPRRRARRSRHDRVGAAAPEGAGDRPLVADRDRLADRGQPGRASSSCRSSSARRRVPMPGYDVQILSEAGTPLRAGRRSARWRSGCRCRRGRCRRCGTPTSGSCSSYLTTFPGYYETGDAGMIDEDGYLYIMARTDDVINVAGHRLSTGAIEEVLAEPPDVAECAVIGVADALKGQLPMGFLCLNRGCARDHAAIVGRSACSWCATGSARWRPSRRRWWSSGCRRPGRARSCAASWAGSPTGSDWKMPATIDDPAILAEIGDSLAQSRLSRALTAELWRPAARVCDPQTDCMCQFPEVRLRLHRESGNNP